MAEYCKYSGALPETQIQFYLCSFLLGQFMIFTRISWMLNNWCIFSITKNLVISTWVLLIVGLAMEFMQERRKQIPMCRSSCYFGGQLFCPDNDESSRADTPPSPRVWYHTIQVLCHFFLARITSTTRHALLSLLTSLIAMIIGTVEHYSSTRDDSHQMKVFNLLPTSTLSVVSSTTAMCCEIGAYSSNHFRNLTSCQHVMLLAVLSAAL